MTFLRRPEGVLKTSASFGQALKSYVYGRFHQRLGKFYKEEVARLKDHYHDDPDNDTPR